MRPRERERENYLSHGICLLVQASDSRAKSYGETKYLCMDQVLDSTFDLVSFFFSFRSPVKCSYP